MTLTKITKKKVTPFSTEIRAYIKVCTTTGKNATEIYENLQSQSLGTSVSRATVFRWVWHFESGKSGISENRGKVKKRVTTSPSAVAAIKTIIDEYAWVRVQEIAERVSIHSSSFLRVLRKDLGLRKLSARWILHILSDDNKGVTLQYAQQLLKKHKNWNKRRLGEILTGDKAWIYFIWASPEVAEHDVARQNGGTFKNRKEIQVNKTGVVHCIPQPETCDPPNAMQKQRTY